MCGIFGSFSDAPPKKLGLVIPTIKHRGPDDDGTWQFGKLYLANVRLSIQDTSPLGHQPMVTEDGDCVLVFNGEIYNHLDLRKELIAKGYTFRSECDTETLLNALRVWGSATLNKLNGIFAFAFYKRSSNELLLARDHLGVKPLYYSYSESALYFSSELKAIVPFLETKSIDEKALCNYLTLLYSPGSRTPLAEIHKLLPGHFITVTFEGSRLKKVENRKYYEIPFTGVYPYQSEKETVDLVDECLQRAVQRQLLADVPVGFFLSGGVDSSLLVAMARKHLQKRLQCFTIDTSQELGGEGFDNDLPYAQTVAKFIDVDLHVSPSDVSIARDFDKMIWHLDEPQADAAPLHVFNISRAARSLGFKVLIGGVGGDDLFSGYRRHQALRFERFYKYFPTVAARAFIYAISSPRSSTLRRTKKVISEVDRPIGQRLANFYSWLPADRAKQLLAPALRRKVEQFQLTQEIFLDGLFSIPNENSWLNRMLYWEQKFFLPDHNLNYTDKMGMAAGVEIRVPYLDVDVVELATKISPELKLRGGTTKYILKKVAERYLPAETVYRAKTGFGAPVRYWVTNQLDEVVKKQLLSADVKDSLFDTKELQALINENRAGTIDASYSIWALLAIQSWFKQFAPMRKSGN